MRRSHCLSLLAVCARSPCPPATPPPRTNRQRVRRAGGRRGALIHRDSTFSFPPTAAGFHRVRHVQYDASGQDVSVEYVHDDPRMTAAIFILPRNGQTAAQELDRRVGEIGARHKGARAVASGPVTVSPGRYKATLAEFQYEGPFGGEQQKLRSRLVVAEQNEWFIVYRITYAASTRAEGEKRRTRCSRIRVQATPARTPRRGHRSPVTTIFCEVHVRAPAARCFDLARSVALHVDSSADIGARAVGGRRGGLSGAGDGTTWSARFFGLRFRMATRIGEFSPPTHFRDTLTHGLLRRFDHLYRFRELPDGGCAMSDELRVAAPFGPLGRLVEAVYLSRRMRGLVRRRLEHVRRVAEGEGWRRYLPADDETMTRP